MPDSTTWSRYSHSLWDLIEADADHTLWMNAHPEIATSSPIKIAGAELGKASAAVQEVWDHPAFVDIYCESAIAADSYDGCASHFTVAEAAEYGFLDPKIWQAPDVFAPLLAMPVSVVLAGHADLPDGIDHAALRRACASSLIFHGDGLQRERSMSAEP